MAIWGGMHQAAEVLVISEAKCDRTSDSVILNAGTLNLTLTLTSWTESRNCAGDSRLEQAGSPQLRDRVWSC